MAVWANPEAPREAQQVIRDVSLQFFAQPEIQKKVREIGMEPASAATPEELVAELREESRRQAALLKSIDYQQQ
ncbi:hypothetical protein D3C78_1881100 [compost metagenome]